MAFIPLFRLHQVPEQKEKYPEFTLFGELLSTPLLTQKKAL